MLEMLFSSLLAVAYLFVPTWFGYVLSRYVLKISNALGLVGMSVVAGQAFLLMLTNLLAYALPLPAVFYGVPLLLLVVACIGQYYGKKVKTIPIELPPTHLVWLWGIIALVVGIMGARYAGSDPWAWTHYPLARTIAAGNFPVMEPINPGYALGYHYGPALLAAAFSFVTGLTVAVGYNIQPLFGVIGIVFCSGALVHMVTRSWKAAFIASMLALAGTGLVWLRVLEFISDPSSLVSDIPALFSSPFTSSLLQFIGHRSFAVGYPFFFALLMTMGMLGQKHSVRTLLGWGATIVALLLALALSMETAFVLLYAALPLFLIALWFSRSSTTVKDLLSSHVVLLLGISGVVALVIAFVQGGILTTLLSPDKGSSSFAFMPDIALHYDTRGYTTGPMSWLFWRNFGFPFILFPIVFAYSVVKRKKQPILLFVSIIALLHFILPFIVRYTERVHEMNRFFYTAMSLSSMLIGVILIEWRRRRSSIASSVITVIVIGSMLVSSAIYVPMRLLFPTMRLQAAPLFATLPSATEEDEKLYEWVRENTSSSVYFYHNTLLEEPENVPEEVAQMRNRVLFMSYTGRFSVGTLLWGRTTQEDKERYQRIERTCSTQEFRDAEIQYLVIDSADRAVWFNNYCDISMWNMQYGEGMALEYPRVYQLGTNS